MLWLKTFYEAVGLPKLDGVAIAVYLKMRMADDSLCRVPDRQNGPSGEIFSEGRIT